MRRHQRDPRKEKRKRFLTSERPREAFSTSQMRQALRASVRSSFVWEDRSPQMHQRKTEEQRASISVVSTPAMSIGSEAFQAQFQEIAASLMLLRRQPPSAQTNRQIQRLIRLSVRMTAMGVHGDSHNACRLPPSLGDLAVLSARAARAWRRRRDDPSDHDHR